MSKPVCVVVHVCYIGQLLFFHVLHRDGSLIRHRGCSDFALKKLRVLHQPSILVAARSLPNVF